MNIVLSIVRRFLIELFRRKANMVYMIIMPILFTLLFGVIPNYGNTSTVPLGIVDLDHSAVSRAYESALAKDGAYQIQTLATGDVTSSIRDNKVALVVTFPQGLERDVVSSKTPNVEVTQSPSIANQMGGNSNYLEDLKSRLSHLTISGQIAVHEAMNQKSTESDLATLFTTGMKNVNLIHPLLSADGKLYSDGGAQQVLPQGQRAVVGFACMFIFFTIFGLSGTIFVERKQGTWARYKAAPVSRTAVIGGYSLSFFIIGWIQYFIMYASGRWLFNIALPMTGWLLVTISLYILAICGLALCGVGLVKSREQHMAIGSTVSVATCMIGGAYWPIDIEPTWMQHVAWFVPQNWALQAFKLIALGTASMSNLFWPLAALAGFTVVFLSVGMVQLRYS